MSTPLCSFIVYLNQDAELIPTFLQDMRSFFNKFPLTYEVLFVIEKGAVGCQQLLESAAMASGEREVITVLLNTQTRQRAESLRQGLNKAQGLYLIVADPAMATPLGDLFKILQHLMSESDLDLCCGERYSKKNSTIANPKTPRHHLENLFNRILKEKLETPHVDPLCETVGIKKASWQRLEANILRQKGWYLGLDIRKHSRHLALKTIEVFVHDSGKSPRSYPLWQARWHLLRKSLL